MANTSCATKIAITLYICLKLTSSLLASDCAMSYKALCHSIVDNKNFREIMVTAEAHPKRFTEGKPMAIMLAMERLESADFTQELVIALMKKGLSVNVRDSFGRSMLHALALRRFKDKEYVIKMVLFLLHLGIDSNSPDKHGLSAEHYRDARLYCVVKNAVESRRKPLEPVGEPNETTSSCHSNPVDGVVQDISIHPNEAARPCLEQEQRAEIVRALLDAFSGSKNDHRSRPVIDE